MPRKIKDQQEEQIVEAEAEPEGIQEPEEEIQEVKPKRVLTEKQLENLKRGLKS